MSQMKELNHLKIPLQAIKNGTQDFNETNFIGKGGYGRVYKGILFWNDYQNLLVAVKQLDVTGFQGSKEFYTEVLMLSQYQHKNIVILIGFCDDGDEMILVYEYASHGSLDTYLSDPSKLGLLSWEKRINICVGAASALDYLHNHVSTNHRIIHRDIKSANILLDENWNAKLSDFGLSKICLANQQNTFVVTNLAGTHGYCDPQYERTGILTKESDVYSFGMVLFEVLCGRLACVLKYHDERRFLHHLARTCYKNGEVDKIIDERMRENIMAEPLNMFSAIAYQCLHKTRELRPTIAEVALTLENVSRIQIGAPIMKTSNHSLPPPPILPTIWENVRDMSLSPIDSTLNDNLLNSGVWAPPPQESVRMRTHIKVYKCGTVGRSINISGYSGYEELKQDLARIFGIEGELEDRETAGWTLVYVDRENDVLIVGDDPWEEFVSYVWCIKIMSPQEVQQMSLDADFGGNNGVLMDQACSSSDGGNV